MFKIELFCLYPWCLFALSTPASFLPQRQYDDDDDDENGHLLQLYASSSQVTGNGDPSGYCWAGMHLARHLNHAYLHSGLTVDLVEICRE